MTRNFYLLLGAVLVAALAGGGWILSQPGNPPGITEFASPAMAQESDSADLPDVVEMTMGNPDAPVTLTEYASFTCPHCRTFHERVFGDLKKNYIDTGKVHFVYREVYFDKFGLWAAMIARCGGQEKYFGIADLLYDTQSEWLATRNDAGIAEDLRKLGLTAGIERDQLDACLSDGQLAQALVAEYQKNASADGVTSTPTLLVNGKKYSNMTYTDLAVILDEALGE